MGCRRKKGRKSGEVQEKEGRKAWTVGGQGRKEGARSEDGSSRRQGRKKKEEQKEGEKNRMPTEGRKLDDEDRRGKGRREEEGM